MLKLSEEQLNSLNHVALVIIAASLQDQLISVSEQLDKANAQLVDNNQKIDFLAEQIRIMNQRKFGKASEKDLLGYDGQMTLFDYFNEAEYSCTAGTSDP